MRVVSGELRRHRKGKDYFYYYYYLNSKLLILKGERVIVFLTKLRLQRLEVLSHQLGRVGSMLRRKAPRTSGRFLLVVVVFLKTKLLNKLCYVEDCCDGTKCINAFSSRHKARPLCLLPFLNHSSGVRKTAGRQGPGPARSSCHSGPCRCQYRRKPGLSPPSPPLRCSLGVGSWRSPSRALHLEEIGNAGRAPLRWQRPAGRWYDRARTHSHTH